MGHLLNELSWLAETRFCSRLAIVPPLPMFKDGDPGFGVEDADEAKEQERKGHNK